MWQRQISGFLGNFAYIVLLLSFKSNFTKYIGVSSINARWSWDRVVGLVTGYGLDDREVGV
jgi:hypothetical protein